MWSFGYNDPITEDEPIDVYWGESDTFPDALSELYTNVEKMLVDAEPYNREHFAAVLGEIDGFRVTNSDMLANPDMWCDQEFTDSHGVFTYYVVNAP